MGIYCCRGTCSMSYGVHAMTTNDNIYRLYKKPKTQEAVLVACTTTTAFDDLKSNLNKLQDLHSKIRTLLNECEDLINKDR